MTDLGRAIAQLQRQVKELQHQSRLSSASLDDTALEVRDGTGSLRGIVGQQGDGTTAVNIVNGGPPPAPSTPTAAPALGGISAEWDGTFADGEVIPLDWARVEVHASPTPAFTPSTETLVATIETAQGGIIYTPSAVPLYVALLARNTSGAASPATAEVGPYAPKPVAGEIGIGEITETLIADGAVTTPKVFANAITTALLAAGAVDATALKADAITGKIITGGEVNGSTITGGIVQTGSSGQRIRLNPAATDPADPAETVPAVELYSGSVNELTPGILHSNVLDGLQAYPYASLTSPAVATMGPGGGVDPLPIVSELRLLSSQPGVRGGSFALTANSNPYADETGDSSVYGYVASNETDTSSLELFCEDGQNAPGGNGSLGARTFLDMSGSEIRLRAASTAGDKSVYMRPTGLTIEAPLSVTEDLTVAGTSQGRGYTAFQAHSSGTGTTTTTTEAIALTQAGVVIKSGRAYRVNAHGLAVNSAASTGVRVRVRKTNTSGAIWLDTYSIATPVANANHHFNIDHIIANNTGADITTTLVMTWISVSGGNSSLNSGLGLYTGFEVLDVGAAANFSDAQSVT